jgi:hypothetical protein
LGRFIGRDPHLRKVQYRNFAIPSEGDGYEDGFNLYSGHFVPSNLDPYGLFSDTCCDETNIKNCIFIFTYHAEPGTMTFGHTSFGTTGDFGIGFHGGGLQLDHIGPNYEHGKTNGTMHNNYLKSVIKCCCLDDASMEKLNKYKKDALEKMAKGDKTGLFGNPYGNKTEVCSTEAQMVINSLNMGCSGQNSIRPPSDGSFETGWFDGTAAFPHRLEKELLGMGNCEKIYDGPAPGSAPQAPQTPPVPPTAAPGYPNIGWGGLGLGGLGR